MIIVSQDKRTIVNLDNMKTIELDERMGFRAINIFRETNEVETGVCGLYIGKYKTEERAKEVLQEIINTYAKIGIVFETYNGGTKQQLPVYEMPLE